MVMEMHKNEWKQNPSLEDIVHVDKWARDAIDSVLDKCNSLYLINK